MKRIGIMVLSVVVLLGSTTSWAMAQKTSSPDYKAQMEAALGGKIVAVQKTTRYPSSSLTQVLNYTVDRGGGRTEVVPVLVVFVKAGDNYVAQSMSLISASSTFAIQRTTPLPTPDASTSGGGGGGGGTTTTTRSRAAQCMDECRSKVSGTGPADVAKYAACYFCCLYGLPFILK